MGSPPYLRPRINGIEHWPYNLYPQCYLCKNRVQQVLVVHRPDGAKLFLAECHGEQEEFAISEEVMRSITGVALGEAFAPPVVFKPAKLIGDGHAIDFQRQEDHEGNEQAVRCEKSQASLLCHGK